MYESVFSPLELINPWLLVLCSLPLLSYLYSVVSLRLLGPKVSLFGPKSIFEPRALANYRFFKDAKSIVNKGYAKSKNTAFWFARNDADIVILPVKHVEEIRNLSNAVANPTLAHAHNLLGRYTKMNIILNSNLHFRVIQSKLTPQLASLTDGMQEEIEFAVKKDFPSCENEWVEIHPYHLILRLVSRLSARVFVGLPLCRDEKWLEISTQFTESVFVTVCFMRLLPTWMHPIASYCLPSNWRGWGYIDAAKKLLVPEIERRAHVWSQEKNDMASEDDLSRSNLLSWMMECAEGIEKEPTHLAHLEIVVSLASIHTSQMNAVHVIYDLAGHPEYVSELREEILAAAKDGWNKTSYARLRKLDSFLKESQRFNPPSVLSYHRVMMHDHVLSDGTKLGKGSHIAMAVNAIQNDPDVTPNPEIFDAFRYYKLRQKPGESHLHQFATTESNMLNFGHGKNACPGRFFASLEIKIILVKLIMNYDFKFAGAEGRPPNLTAHEFIFPNPEGRLLVRARSAAERFDFPEAATG